MRKPTKTNGVLLTIIGMLTMVLLARSDAGSFAWAQVGQPTNDPPFNAAEQRKMMILSLQQINNRVAAMETKLNSGLSVKVTEMPPVIIKETQKK